MFRWLIQIMDVNNMFILLISCSTEFSTDMILFIGWDRCLTTSDIARQENYRSLVEVSGIVHASIERSS